ncbi:MAG: tRNA (adenosine(37)-N6)-threonylcarbamoyltransferase complex transferase subunit TsaD [Helicobacteraceae bacterium]|jgi:N6-L-threonylcarbamoyladenine synthase|nr:tRNA (adenosine(37)-N6)-threonylcarbamoyltransferase complex transferase subunit TsaD [Helicobacteraceae bacterium]
MILSIESSCDDSSVAITDIKTKKLIFHRKISQELEHAVYGGVVPELASRLHAEALPKILEECQPYFENVKAIAVTNAPGLAVTLIEGITMAKALSVSLDLPLIAVNHLKGHIYSLFIDKETLFPQTVLLVSGGHTQVIEVKSLNEMKTVAATMDDSFGESFDKVAKMMGLAYPGGPVIEKLAKEGNPKAYPFTIPLQQKKIFAFSYSGIKNAVRLAVEEGSEADYANIAASFQEVASEHLIRKIKKYLVEHPPKNFAIVGGASANLYLRNKVETMLAPYGAKLHLAELQYCSDNAAMIGRVAVEMYRAGDFISIEELQASPRAPL